MSTINTQLVERHETLYFTDGNVVLHASRLDQPALLFRLHKSILSSHSPIFSDMFDIGNPSPGDATGGNKTDQFYDGVPLVHMSDDANHLAFVLKILYYQSTVPWTPYSPFYPTLVRPILELSRKYGIDRLRDQIVKHIEYDWPLTLQEWDKMERDVEFMTNDLSTQCIDDHFPEPASAIQLARQFDIPSILPAAFYHLSRLSILDDWDKTHADPSIIIQNPTKRTARWGLLSAKDFHCVLFGKAEFAKTLLGCLEIGPLRHRDNLFDTSCGIGERVWKDFRDRCSTSMDPLALLKKPITVEWNQGRNCPTCMEMLRVKIPRIREQIWEKLGDVFHLKDE